MRQSSRLYIESLYGDYVALRHGGLSKESALEKFGYCHVITVARLKFRIEQAEPADSYLAIVDAELRRNVSALENTEPSIALDEPAMAPRKQAM